MGASPYTHLLVGPDFGAFPVWDRSPRHLGGMVRPEYLGLSDDLVKALDAWALEWEAEDTAAWDETAWNTRGRALTADLQQELGPEVVVAYYEDGIDAPPFDLAGFAEDHKAGSPDETRPPGFSIR